MAASRRVYYTMAVKNEPSRAGPPTSTAGVPASALSASRESVLEALDERAEPISIAALVAVTGLHVNTLREHLDALADAGLVRRERAAATGRGRPAWLYSAMPEDETHSEIAEYAGLASALAEVIEQSSSSPAATRSRRAGAGGGSSPAKAGRTPKRGGRPTTGRAAARRSRVRPSAGRAADGRQADPLSAARGRISLSRDRLRGASRDRPRRPRDVRRGRRRRGPAGVQRAGCLPARAGRPGALDEGRQP